MTIGQEHNRDSGRYDPITQSWVDSSVQIDFAWGNIPMQPDDDRIWGTANEFPGWSTPLDPALDSHEIAVDGWSGFPAFIPNLEDRTSDYAPNVVGLSLSDAQDLIASQGFVWDEGESGTTSDGATSQNDGTVAAQSPAAGDWTAGDGTYISTLTYAYVVPGPPTTGPVDAMTKNGITSPLDPTVDIYMYLVGRTVKPAVDDYVHITGNAKSGYNTNNYQVISVENDDAWNTGGTKVLLHSVTGDITGTGTGAGGTWNKL